MSQFQCSKGASKVTAIGGGDDDQDKEDLLINSCCLIVAIIFLNHGPKHSKPLQLSLKTILKKTEQMSNFDPLHQPLPS